MGTLDGDIARVIDLYPKIFFACHRRHVRDPKTQREVSERQVQILDHLDEKLPTRLSELADHLGVTASTMSLAIDRLERAGYARRTKGARDRRQVDVRLTGSGARVREAHSVLDQERVHALLSHLPKGERTAALDGLEVLARAALDMTTGRSRNAIGRQARGEVA